MSMSTAPCARTIYGLRLLRAHGMSDYCIQEVFRSIVLAKLVYASPAWLGVWSASDVNKLDKFFNRCKRLNYCNQTTACITEQFDQADESIFQTVTSDSHHVLHRFLPAIRNQRCKLRPRTRSFTVTCKIVANRPFAITVILSYTCILFSDAVTPHERFFIR